MRGMYETVGGQIEPPIPRSPLHRPVAARLCDSVLRCFRSPLRRSVTSFRRSPLRRSVTPFRRDSVLRCFATLIQK